MLGLSLALPAVRSIPWNPNNLGASLVAWWDAQEASSFTLNGSNVAAWRDKKSGHSLAQAAASGQPAYSATGFDGTRPGVTYDGTSDLLTVASGFPNVSQPFSVWMVITGYASGTGDAHLYREGANAVGYRAGGAATWSMFAGSVVSSAGAYTAGAAIRGDIYNGASSAIDSNGTLYTGNPGTGALSTGGVFNLGSATGAFPALKFGEVLVVSASLTTDQRQRLEGYLAHRWGINSSLPADHPFKSVRP